MAGCDCKLVRLQISNHSALYISRLDEFRLERPRNIELSGLGGSVSGLAVKT